MKKITKTGRRFGMLSSVGIAALIIAVPAVAQDAADEKDEEATVTTTEKDKLDEQGITVTGSRIRRPEIAGLEPTTSISSEYFADRNLTNVGDALNELPQFRGSVTQRGDQSAFGNGVNFINTFGLGSNRTLTLINGRRVVSSNLPSLFGPGGAGVQVDLNVIPAQLIERIDNVSVGGAPVYGSDAIAGTVNLILKTRYDGLSLTGTAGLTERGDAFNYNVGGLFGKNFDEGRGNITLSVAYDVAEGLRGVDRKHTRDALGFLNNCTTAGVTAPVNDGRINPNIGCNTSTTDGVPARILFRNLRSPFLSQSGVVRINGALSGLQFGEGGNLVPVAPGTQLTGFFQSGGNTYDTTDQTNITADLERFTVNAFGAYEITPGVEVFFEGLYYKASSFEEGNNPSFNTFVFDPGVSGGLTYDTATVPFISAATRATLLARGATRFNLSRSNEDLFDNGSRSETELKRGVIGVRGDFEAVGRPLNYEVTFNYGTNDILNFQQNINQQRFINAVSFTQGPNGPVCTTTPVGGAVAPGQPVQPIADPRCVPLNLFGFRQASQAALNYIREDTIEAANVRQFVFNANVGGELFDLWAGPVGFNIGYEHRDEKASFTPSSFTQNGGGRGAAIAPTAGRYNVDEVFGEVLIPLVSPDNDVPLVHAAEVFGRARYVDNTVNGGFLSWAAGGRIAIIPDISFRGNFTRSFRAPAITELFLPQSPTFERPSDLCTLQARAAGPVPATRTRNCNAFLQATNNDPATYTLLAAQASVAGLSGGNPNLDNEKADSFTFGTIINPRFVRGLTITADYVDINISGPIANLTTAQISSGCFDNPSFDLNNPINGNAFCSQLGFGANGQIPNDPTNPRVRTGFVNGQSVRFKGITGALDYVTELSGIGLPGSIRVGGDMLYVKERINDITGVAPQRSDGTVGDPEFSGQARFVYSDKRWGVGTYINYTGEQLLSRFNRGGSPNDTREFDQYSDFVTVNANIFFATENNFRFNFSVTNLTDRIGQGYFGFIIPGSVNDNLGRRFNVSVSKNF